MDYPHYTPFIPGRIYYSTLISYPDGAFSIYVQPPQNMSSDHPLPIPMSPGIDDVGLQYESPDAWTNLLYQIPNLDQQSEIFNANEDVENEYSVPNWPLPSTVEALSATPKKLVPEEKRSATGDDLDPTHRSFEKNGLEDEYSVKWSPPSTVNSNPASPTASFGNPSANNQDSRPRNRRQRPIGKRVKCLFCRRSIVDMRKHLWLIHGETKE
jgi:hypothetical protein